MRDPQVLRDAAIRLAELEAEVATLKGSAPFPATLSGPELLEAQGFPGARDEG